MQENINKIFDIFNDNKNNKFFKLCIEQLSNIQRVNIQTTQSILDKCLKLLNSKVWDQRLIAASIIEKCLENYQKSIYQIDKNQENFIQNYLVLNIKNENYFINSETKGKFYNLQEIDPQKNYSLDQIDFQKLIKTQPPLMGRDEKIYQTQKQIINEEEQDQILKQFGLSLKFDLESLINLCQSQNKIQMPDEDQPKKDKKIKKVKLEETQIKSNIMDVLNEKQKNIFVETPFNKIFYNFALQNLFSLNWELRHSSALVIRSFIRQNGYRFLGFNMSIGSEINMNQDKEKIINSIQQNYFKFLQDQEKRKQQFYENVFTKNMILLCLDRFSDYLFDKSYLVVGEYVIQNLVQILQEDCLDQNLIKNILNLIESIITDQNWQVIQSGLLLIKNILIKIPQWSKIIFDKYNQIFENIFDLNEDIQVILSEIIIFFNQIDEFQNQNQLFLKKILTKSWNFLQQNDDISYAQVSVINMICLFQRDKKLLQFMNPQSIPFDFYLKTILPFFSSLQVKARNEALQFCTFLLPLISNHKLILKTLKELFIVSIQCLFIYDEKQSIENILKICQQLFVLMYDLDKQFFIEQIQYIDQTLKIVDLDQMIEKFQIPMKINTDNKFEILQYFERTILISHLFINTNNQVISELIKNTDNSLLITNIGNFTNFDNKQILKLAEKSLILEEYQVNRNDIENTDIYIIETLKKFMILLQRYEKNKEIEFLQNFIHIESIIARKQKYEELYKFINNILKSMDNDINLINCGKQIIKLINNQVKNSREYLNIIKTSAASFIIKNCIHENKKFQNINLIIKPILKALIEPNFEFLQLISSDSLFQMIQKSFQSPQDPSLKITKSLLTQFCEKNEQTFIEQLNQIRKQKEIQSYSTFMKKNNGLQLFFEKMISHYGKEFFKHFIQIEKMEIQDEKQIDKCLKIYKVLTPIISKYKFQQEIKQLTNITLQICIKDSCNDKMLKNLNKILSNLIVKNINNDYFLEFLEQIYPLIKQRNIVFIRVVKYIFENFTEDVINLASLFIIPIIKSLNDENQIKRTLGYETLSFLINSIWVRDLSSNVLFRNNEYFLKKCKKGNAFIMDFKNNKNFEMNFVLNVKNVELRPYQLEGIKWLSFLVKYNMHGALCDDMGLGKTLQTLAVLQNEIYKNKQKNQICQSLILCPTTLQDHWLNEINKYTDTSLITSNIFRQNNNIQSDITIISYNQYIKNINLFANQQFLFAILDEGHCIKNSKAKIAKSVKLIKAKHRLILSGTPIQNNLLELWSIFDFLNPGYLGDEDKFKNQYLKSFQTNILQFDDSQLIFDEKQQKNLDNLHKIIMPFILRRMKQDVLQDLPPKIIQDYYCSMSEIQKEFYNYLDDSDIQSLNQKNKDSVLQKLINLRKICNHPLMMSQIPDYNKILQKNKFTESQLNDYQNAGKLLALEDIFEELGYDQDNQNQDILFKSFQNKNKVIIFSRFRQTLQIIGKQFLSQRFPKIKYLILDGNVQPEKRFSIINSFNNDCDINVLLLTTQVGGVGLNLTSANVVVMFDHDFNPMNDMQAIDRAHRIGQKNILNVHRLIMKDTFEEKILGNLKKIQLILLSILIMLVQKMYKKVILQIYSQKHKIKIKDNKDQYNPYAKFLKNLDELWDENEYQKEF